MKTDATDTYTELVEERSPYLFCDVCMHYPILPMHGHFMCPSCYTVTKCCEVGPMTMETADA